MVLVRYSVYRYGYGYRYHIGKLLGFTFKYKYYLVVHIHQDVDFGWLGSMRRLVPLIQNDFLATIHHSYSRFHPQPS